MTTPHARTSLHRRRRAALIGVAVLAALLPPLVPFIVAAQSSIVRESVSTVVNGNSSSTVSVAKPEVQALYERIGFRDAGLPLQRVTGAVQIRTGPLEVDDTLRTLSISTRVVRRTDDTDQRRQT